MKNIDITGSYHKPFWFPFASVYVPVTPCVLDGSLSFLEMVWKLLRDLNKTIEATNANHSDILTLVDEINKLYGSKLSYIVVNFTQPNPLLAEITADTDYSDIIKGYADGIVLGQFNGDLYIALGYDSDNKVVSLYSLNGINLRRIEDNENRISYYNEKIITNNGGTITGVLNLTRTPADGNEASNKKYVDNQDAITLQAAKTYANQQDAITLQAAKTYADKQDTITLQAAKTYAEQQDGITLQAAKTYANQQDEITLKDAKTYAEQQDAITLQAAKTYAEQQDAITLQAAKTYANQQNEITLKAANTYADQNFVRTNGNSGRTYASRNITEAEFTNIPTAPDTITITALLEKLARWYEEIKNKITRATITKDNDVYTCDKTFATLYQLITDGQEVQIAFNDPLLSNVGTSIMRLERYTTTTITFTGDNHTCTINNSNVISFS